MARSNNPKRKRKPHGLQWDLDGELKEEARKVSNTPPTSPSPPHACLYESPATREAIRRKLKELGVTNINQLIRTWRASDLLEAISDYQRARETGMRILSPTGYFRNLLNDG